MFKELFIEKTDRFFKATKFKVGDTICRKEAVNFSQKETFKITNVYSGGYDLSNGNFLNVKQSEKYVKCEN